MARLNEVLSGIVADKKITNDEVATIRTYIEQDGQLDLQDVKFLVELLSQAKEVCPAFDELFFPILKDVVLADGKIGRDEQFYLLKMLYADGNIRYSEKQFLVKLRAAATEVPEEFDELCSIAFAAHPTNWSIDGPAPSSYSSTSGF
jgi:hypothetical protein